MRYCLLNKKKSIEKRTLVKYSQTPNKFRSLIIIITIGAQHVQNIIIDNNFLTVQNTQYNNQDRHQNHFNNNGPHPVSWGSYFIILESFYGEVADSHVCRLHEAAVLVLALKVFLAIDPAMDNSLF